MAKKKSKLPFEPIILDVDKHEKRRVIRHLPGVHQTETLQKFFGSSVDHLFDPGRGKSINGYVGQKPLWYDPDQDYYLVEEDKSRSFYQLEASMVSKSKEGELTSILTYDDLVNHLRFQGAITNNHNRLFSQDYYAWCPPVDLDKIINFRQYIWLDTSVNHDNLVIDLYGPTAEYVGDYVTVEFKLPGYGDNPVDARDFYELPLLKANRIIAKVDGNIVPFTYVAGSDKITMVNPPPQDAVVVISVYSDLENTAIGLQYADPIATGGIKLSTGMRVRVVKDRDMDFQPTDVYVVEGVGTSISFIKEVPVESSEKDYMVVSRGSASKNEWSTGNRWFHVDTIPEELDEKIVDEFRAQRPIIEFNKDLELFNYGLKRRLDVDMVVETIEDLNAELAINPTAVTINGVDFTITPNGLTVDAIDPDTGLSYGEVTFFRIMVRRTVNPLINNNVLVLINQSGEFKLILETDGENPSGLPAFGELFKVKLGTYAGRNLHWDGSEWVVSQHKSGVNQAPLFELYDLDGIRLRDVNRYPSSTFKGSKLFGYKVDLTGSRLADKILGIPLVHDTKGQILFENFVATEKFTFLEASKVTTIQGFYFHKTGNINRDFEILNNDWYKSDSKSKQKIVDQFTATGKTKIFRVSQPDGDITVSRGRVVADGSFTKTNLVEDVDFLRDGRRVMIYDVSVGDSIDITTFSPSSPPEDATGFYEIPLNLQANPDNEVVSDLTKGDFYDHFSSILENQIGFTGASYSRNNYRDTPKTPNKGLHIVQHSAPLLKTMLLASDANLDIMNAMRYVSSEYNRFKFKLIQKLIEFDMNLSMVNAISYDVWINNALSDINKGKNKSFPFYLSTMAQNSTIPTYIPPTPSFLGVYPLSEPSLSEIDTTDDDGIAITMYFVKGHDGSLTEVASLNVAQVLLAYEQRVYDSAPESIRQRIRPIVDIMSFYGDAFRTGDYSYEEYLKVLRPAFERWCLANEQDYTTNELSGYYDDNDPWSWNWSSVPNYMGQKVPGHWRGIYEMYYGTSRPDIYPWECLGFTNQPDWWNNRYGIAPYTSENTLLWEDIAAGYIADGPNRGYHPSLARHGILEHIPVNSNGDLRHPGPRWLTDDGGNVGENLTEDEYLDLELGNSYILGSGLIPAVPLIKEARSDWSWGDVGPVELLWRRSVEYPFAVAQAGYLMKPVEFVELGWNSADVEVYFEGKTNEQLLSQDTMGRPKNTLLQTHGEVLEDFSLVSKHGIQQWISDLLMSQNKSIKTSIADKIRGLSVQMSYKVGGFTDSGNLVVVSDAFGRLPSEDIGILLYRSPSIREETYSGVMVEMVENGFKIYGYNQLDPFFDTLPGDPNGRKIGVGENFKGIETPEWKPSAYYSVNSIVRFNDDFFACSKTHTAGSYFERNFWNQIERPIYADGSRLAWYLDSYPDGAVTRVKYGTVLKRPQDVANFLNGYGRFLESRGWVFDETDDIETKDWRMSLAQFITWSTDSDRDIGDYVSLSPSSGLVKFKSDYGTIQPIEQVVNGLYAVVDQFGKPIDNRQTRVVRNDGDIKIICDTNDVGIYGVRLYISEIEHVLVFNNRTIFGDILYSPLLNIKQPRLRLQGFKSINWAGRIDAPGFVVTDNTLIPNFERTADDFRRFFDIEAMENKDLQDRARSNFGYSEKDYLNNLLLTPTNQFEFYQGMIQQKGSLTSMRRLLRSNFVRHNKGLQLFEEWAFRVGEYGGQEVSPSMDLQLKQVDFVNNPQLIEFHNSDIDDEYGKVRVRDISYQDGPKLSYNFDKRWHWRPDMSEIQWSFNTLETEEKVPTAGHVNLDEVDFTAVTNDEFETLYYDLRSDDREILDGHRVWVYGVGSGSAKDGWKTYKFHNTDFKITNVIVNSFDGQGSVVVLDQYPHNGVDGPYLNQDGAAERLIINNVQDGVLTDTRVVYPKYSGSRTIELTNSSEYYLMDLLAEPEMVIDKITVTVVEKFAEGSELIVGHDEQLDYFVQMNQPSERDINPFDYTNETILITTPDTTYIAGGGGVIDFEVPLVRVGTISDVCGETIAKWSWKVDGIVVAEGYVTFIPPSDYQDYNSDVDVHTQVITIPLTAGQITSGTLTVSIVEVMGDPDIPVIEVLSPSDEKVLTFVPSSQAMYPFVDLMTNGGVFEFTNGVDFNGDILADQVQGLAMLVNLTTPSTIGKAIITVDYRYKKGFELLVTDVEGLVPFTVVTGGGTADLYQWINTRYETFADLNSTDDNLWDDGDIAEVTNYGTGQGWETYRFDGSEWVIHRRQIRKINSELLNNAALYDIDKNSLKAVLQLYDPAKGFIPGMVDRELEYKSLTDPAKYGDSRHSWGSDQVNQLWWDLSTTRYLDYEIQDNVSGGIEYRWKNWGRLAPGIKPDVYQWVRSPVPPMDWDSYINRREHEYNPNRPSGTLPKGADTPFIQADEWNNVHQREEVVYYFWVRNPVTLPIDDNRNITAQQVSNVIERPMVNDIPFFAVIDFNKLIVGGVNQYLDDDNTILKVKWFLESDIVNNHHKQWSIIRENDERNTIEPKLWAKMRDSLVGWDRYTDEQGNYNPLLVPDPMLPKAQQVGSLFRPRQSWFPASINPKGGLRPSRSARQAFVDVFNEILLDEPFYDQWYDWEDIFTNGDPLPDSSRYVQVALDLSDLDNLLPAARMAVNVGECVLIENTIEAAGLWTLWKLIIKDGQRAFILEDFQKWRLQEGELWSLTDWYDDGWSAKNFPNYRFETHEERDQKGNLDVTLLKGTLVQIDNQSAVDPRWSWDVYTSTSKYQVAKEKGTIKLNDAFFDETRIEFDSYEQAALLATPEDERITPLRLQELADLMNNRDGTRELQYLLDTLENRLLTTVQKNKLFFGMVKTAFIHGKVDWAFKTSFLYLGGYSESLRQSPVAFKDQIDNVISYLEDVKPYHVKIREYVRRLSYGPDVADLSITDFDKPPFPVGSNYVILNENNPSDITTMLNNRPWLYWANNFEKETNPVERWDTEWNGVRKMTTKMKFDRIACGTYGGWDTSPWNAATVVYSQLTGESTHFGELLSEYRNNSNVSGPNPYNDTSVNTIEERNMLVRNGIVTSSLPGTIVTVIETEKNYIWTGHSWLEFEALGWQNDQFFGAISRVEKDYTPLPGMVKADDPSLISGCEFGGTSISSYFNDGILDVFEWGSTGMASEYDERIGYDVDMIIGSAKSSDPSAIDITGGAFNMPGSTAGRPEELVNFQGRDSVIFTVIRQDGSNNQVIKQMTDYFGKNERIIAPLDNDVEYVGYDIEARTVTLNVPDLSEDADGFTAIHDPMNPSSGFIREVGLSQSYDAKLPSSSPLSVTQVFSMPGFDNIPLGLISDDEHEPARVAIVHPSNSTKRVLGTVTPINPDSNGNVVWNDSFEVTLDAGFESLGRSKNWKIIPLSNFEEKGVVWIGNARVTYTSITWNGNEAVLNNVKISGATLGSLVGTSSTTPSSRINDDSTIVSDSIIHVMNKEDATLVSDSVKVYDGSIHRRVVE